MAESRRLYRWTLGWEDQLTAVAAQQHLVEAMRRWGLRWPWFMEGRVSFTRTGELLVEATIRGRDQWWVHHRQTQLLVAMAAALRVPRARFGEPAVERLAPHTNRGRAASRRPEAHDRV